MTPMARLSMWKYLSAPVLRTSSASPKKAVWCSRLTRMAISDTSTRQRTATDLMLIPSGVTVEPLNSVHNGTYTTANVKVMAKSFSHPRILPQRGGLRLSDQQRKAATIWYNWYAGGGGAQLTQASVSQGAATTLNLTFNGSTTITTDGWSINTDSENALSISSVSGSGTSTPSFTLSREILPG